jgi:hypothetical protein
MKINSYNNSTPTTSTKLIGSNSTGETFNFTLQSVFDLIYSGVLNVSPSVVTTNSLTSATISSTNTYFTGTVAGASFAITFPAANPNLNGIKYTVMSLVQRVSTTWISSGATFVGAPGTLSPSSLATPVCFQYNHSDLKWYISL